MVVTHNLTAQNASRQFNIVVGNRAKTTEKLSSGYRINRAADDAAGLAISEKMRWNIRGLDRAAKNTEDGISYVQVADGALAEVHDMLQRINELAVQASNDTNTPFDREQINHEVQELKTEMQRIFETTEFNTLKIWDEPKVASTTVIREPQPDTVEPVGKITPPTQSFSITNANYDKMAVGKYSFNANADGLKITWKAYDGNNYSTRQIDWNELESCNYNFNIGTYFNSDLKDASGNPLFGFNIAVDINNAASRNDIIDFFNSSYLGAGTSVEHMFSFENIVDPNPWNFYSQFIDDCGWCFASRQNSILNGIPDGFTFDGTNDAFLSPKDNGFGGNLSVISGNNTIDPNIARNSTEAWEFKFDVAGVGILTFKAESISVYDCDTGVVTYLKDINGNESGSLSALMGLFDGSFDLNHQYSFDIQFGHGEISPPYNSIKYDTTLDYASNIHTFSLPGCTPTNFSLTPENLLAHINIGLNQNTVLNNVATNNNPLALITPHNSNATITVHHPDRITTIETLDKTKKKLWIQSGATNLNGMMLEYDNLRLKTLGLDNTAVDTYPKAQKTMAEVAHAIDYISGQRALFGAWQNRFEHTNNNDKNISENTQAAESRLRDADMALEMVDYSKHNILTQVGQSMISQANQSQQGVLSLLQ